MTSERKIDGKYQSQYLLEAESIKEKLDEVSPSFCLAKWFHVSLHMPTGQTHSCYHPASHHIPIEEVKIDVSALHNTKHKKLQRQAMLLGIRPKECEFCWQIEDSGDQLSDRAYRSKDVWETDIIKEAITVGASGNAKPRYLEVNFNQACNFKCAYCSPHLSTEWMDEIKHHGPYQLTDRIHNDISWITNLDNSPSNPYLTAFWEWLPEIYPTLQTFRMTGGEPLMDKNTFRMFDYIKTNPKYDLQLSITSNCCPPGNQWAKFIDSLHAITDCVKHFQLFCSLDSWGKQAEYIRNGLNFDTLTNNVREYLSISRNNTLTFIITFNALSYTRIYEYMKNILALRQEFNKTQQLIWFDIPPLHSPDYLNPKILPEMITELERTIAYMNSNKETKATHWKGFKDFEISKLQRLVDWIQTDNGFDKTTAMSNFSKFFDEHDSRRGTKLLETFPELTSFYNSCKQL